MTRRSRASVQDWRENYVTTDALGLRLEVMRRFKRGTGAFGLDVLRRRDVHGRRVLEIGPGTGLHASGFLARTGAVPASWVALDRSEAMARATRSACRDDRGVHVVVGDAELLPVAARTRFDLVVAMHVLPFAAHPRRVLEALAARLAKDGRVLVTVHGDDDGRDVRRAIRRAVRDSGLPWRPIATIGYSRTPAERDLRSVFRTVDVHVEDVALHLPDPDWAVRYFGSMPWLGGLPASVRRRADAAVRTLARHAIERGGELRVPKGSVTLVASQPRRRR